MITAQYSINRFSTRYVYYRCTKKKGGCSQPYLQESTLSAQIKTLLQAVSLPVSEIEKMERKIDEWEQESISEKGSVVQNLKSELSATQEKLDKLVSIYLDGDIERGIYLERKDILLRQKAGIEESLKDFGQQRKNWIEPLRSFVLSLKEAVDLEKSDNQLAWKQFFQKIGSNPEIKDKTIHMHSGEIWDFVASAKGGSGLPSASFASQNSPLISNFANVSLGELIIHFARTFFEGKT